MTERLPVAVVGAGPIGLAAAAHLAERELTPLVLEAGDEPGAAVARWRHVRLFSPWSELVDPAAVRLLTRTGWRAPDPDRMPTGAEWLESYLRPLAAALGDRVRCAARVAGVARRGRDRTVDAGRDDEPFTVHLRTPSGDERMTVRAVIDASGTWNEPNPLGGDGLPALGEHAAAERITYRVPDTTLPPVRARYSGARTAVVGSGHSALTALAAITALPGARVVWVLRRPAIGNAFGGIEDDPLPARVALGERARAATRAGQMDTVTGFRAMAVRRAADGRLVLVSVAGQRLDPVDEIVVLTGFRPDLSWLSEIRLDLDPALQAPRKLAPLIDPNVHTCNTVPQHGAGELAHPEPNLYLAGMKSYGRAPTFLASTGYQQVRSVVTTLTEALP